MLKIHKFLLLALVIGVVPALAQNQQISPALKALFDAERAFAKRCGEVGIRASFTEFFADDGIAFRPHPVKFKEAVKDRPAPPNPLAFELLWEPIFGEVSAAGDLGYDAGPSIFTDKTAEKPAPSYGFFFSVWKKQTDGTWKVALDLGTDTNVPYTGSREPQTAPPDKMKPSAAKVEIEAERTKLLEVDRAFNQASQTEGAVKAFAKYLTPTARLHRNGHLPILGQDAALKFLRKTSFTQTWSPSFVEVAQSGDLGYTYGGYELKEGNKLEKGYYVRMWKHGANAQWQVVLDVTSPLPPAEK